MAKIITDAAQIQRSNDTKYDTVPVPEWGDEDSVIRIRSLTAGELIKFTSLKGENAKEGMVRGLILSAVDEDGNPVFDLTRDRPWLLTKNVAVLQRCQNAILILNEMKKPPVAEGEEEETELERAVKS